MKHCIKCDYILDELPDPRCPECGLAFDPLDPSTYGAAPNLPVTPQLLHIAKISIAAFVVQAGLVSTSFIQPRSEVGYVLAPIILVGTFLLNPLFMGGFAAVGPNRRRPGPFTSGVLALALCEIYSGFFVLASQSLALTGMDGRELFALSCTSIGQSFFGGIGGLLAGNLGRRRQP